MRASFVVIGSLYPGTHVAYVKSRPSGCALETRINFTGNDDDYTLRTRVKHALAKARKAKLPLPATSSAAGR